MVNLEIKGIFLLVGCIFQIFEPFINPPSAVDFLANPWTIVEIAYRRQSWKYTQTDVQIFSFL